MARSRCPNLPHPVRIRPRQVHPPQGLRLFHATLGRGHLHGPMNAVDLTVQTKPGKRAPTAAMCESDENYVPLNDGYNWKGDPNATTSGQAIPQLPPGTPGSTALPPAPLAVAEYDPATGTYVGPDGKTYTQANLARDANQHQTWQDMLSPPKGH